MAEGPLNEPTADALQEALEPILGAEGINAEQWVEGYVVDGLGPTGVAIPRTVEQVSQVLRTAHRLRAAVIPFGAGTLVEIGNPPERYDLALVMGELNHVVEYQPADLTVTVEAGMALGLLQRILGEHGQMLPCDPPLGDRATIGGIVATNASGPWRLMYGTVRDRLLGVTVVQADGTVIRGGGKVVKNVAGYDLPKLFAGSFGTLGVIVEATLKVAPLPQGRGTVVAAFERCTDAMEAALRLLGQGFSPMSLDLVGPNATAVLTAETRAEPPAQSYLLAAELGGARNAVQRQGRDFTLAATAQGSREVTYLEPQQRHAFWRRIHDFGRSEADPAAMIVRAGVLPTEVAPVIAAVQEAGAALGQTPTVIARAGNGVVYSYWQHGEPEVLLRAVERLTAIAREHRGTAVVEKAPREVKDRIDVFGPAGPELALMRRIKEQFDPDRILSPGRMQGRI